MGSPAYSGADEVYNDTYTPFAFVVLLNGALLWATSTTLLARSAAGLPTVRRSAAWLYGVSGPLIAVLGVMVGEAPDHGIGGGTRWGALLAHDVTA